MHTDYSYKTYSISLLFNLVVCCGLTACIPGPNIEYDNPFDSSFDKVVIGKTKRNYVHQLFGKPLISNVEWRVDLYRGYGKVAYTMIAPLPSYMTDSEPYYILLVYDEDNYVNSLDSGAVHVDTDGFDFWGYRFADKYLLAPKGHSKIGRGLHKPLDKCILYLLPYGGEELSLNGSYISGARVGIYFRWFLSPGRYHISSYFPYGDENITQNVVCEPAQVLYAHVMRKHIFSPRLESGQKGLRFEIKISDVAPEEIFKRQMVIYPTLPEIPNILLNPEEAKKQEDGRLEEIIKHAEEGDAEAMYLVFSSMSSDITEPVTAWEWLCKSADQDYAKAQFEVAYWYRTINWELAQPVRLEWLREAGVHADEQIAYMWYTLAARGDEERLRARDNLFYGTLTDEEIEEAEEMIRNWKPGQCERDLVTDDTVE